ncbi:S8 family serine peptidase [Streptomyces yunnanensis]|uniref:S8 family serine peptidase n=1 Tax=Streptomyces yunnanensis TaxID=156453 RepID=A0ABY8A726_9ACTN|nr:S8 family serine peptidase [Streptomyces yunnanensis]WEB40116.1 S8 family serine peptidase [Streptomyces yunnanensis]
MSFTRTLRAVGGAVVAGALLLGTAPVASADQIRNEQWPLQKFDAESIWKISTGKGVTVAVLDTPVDGSHPDLTGSVLPGKNFGTGSGPANQGTGDDADHGTAMASLIAGHGHGAGGADGVKGLAPDAKILPVAIPGVSDKSGQEIDFAQELRYAVDQGAKVVNMSFVTGQLSAITPEEQQAIDYARKHDVLLVAGSGNDGISTPAIPAAAPGVLAVGAVDDHGEVWKKSNFGPHVKLTAPGVNIRSATPVVDIHGKYRLADGTSDSTAYVSAAAALLRAKFPDLSAGQIANRLIKTASLPADQQGMTLPDQHYGYGSINPLSALTKDIPAGSKDGPFPAVGGGSSGPSSDPSNAAGDDNGNLKIQSHKGLSTPFIILIAVVVLVLLVIVLIVVMVAKKKGRNGPPPGGPGGFGGPGGPGGPGGFMPNQQPPYQQQPGAPGSYPQGPPTQPPGR